MKRSPSPQDASSPKKPKPDECWITIGTHTYFVDPQSKEMFRKLKNGRLSPCVGTVKQSEDGEPEYLIDPQSHSGEWVGELLDAVVPSPFWMKPDLELPDAVVETLSEGRVAVWDEFLAEDEVKSMRRLLERLFLTPGGPMSTRNHGQESQVRTDNIVFFGLNEDDDDNEVCEDEMRDVYGMMEHVAQRLNEKHGYNLLAPPLGMASVYDGNDSKYVYHFDNEKDPDTGKWRNHRVLTTVLYLNEPDWSPQDGGTFRYADVKDGKEVDLPPTGGSLVVFDSRTIKHQVTASKRRRFAMTLWFLHANPDEDK